MTTDPKSATPRTDQFSSNIERQIQSGNTRYDEMVLFARHLERELADCQAKLNHHADLIRGQASLAAHAEGEGAVKVAQVIRAPGKSVLSPTPETIAMTAPSAASGLADTLEKDLADTDDHNQPWYFKKHEMEQIIAALRSRQAPRGDRDSVIEECARLADAHKGSAAKAISVTRWKQMDEETRQEIRAEQRGEDIASEVIASAIRVLKTPPSPQTGGES